MIDTFKLIKNCWAMYSYCAIETVGDMMFNLLVLCKESIPSICIIFLNRITRQKSTKFCMILETWTINSK